MVIGPVTRYDQPRAATFNVPTPANGLPLVFIEAGALRAIYEHAADGFPVEIGGYCLGLPLTDVTAQANATYLQENVRAVATSTRTHVTMHPESFHAVEARRAETGTLVVGYYHSHPGLTVFQSGEDVRNFRSYHPESYQIAIVADSSLTDPDRLNLDAAWIGFYAWDCAGRPVKLPGENLFLATLDNPAFAPPPTDGFPDTAQDGQPGNADG